MILNVLSYKLISCCNDIYCYVADTGLYFIFEAKGLCWGDKAFRGQVHVDKIALYPPLLAGHMLLVGHCISANGMPDCFGSAKRNKSGTTVASYIVVACGLSISNIFHLRSLLKCTFLNACKICPFLF